jgi:hypothetical protein
LGNRTQCGQPTDLLLELGRGDEFLFDVADDGMDPLLVLLLDERVDDVLLEVLSADLALLERSYNYNCMGYLSQSSFCNASVKYTSSSI